jgi:hypothetical protein
VADEETKADVRKKLSDLATDGGFVSGLLLSLHNLKLLELLNIVGDAKSMTNDLRQQEAEFRAQAIREYGRIPPLAPDHVEAYRVTNKSFDAVDEAFEQVLEAATLLYLIFDQCECDSCRHRRQREKADEN